MRKTFAELLTLHTAEERGTDAEIKKRIHAVAKVRRIMHGQTDLVSTKTKATFEYFLNSCCRSP